jgi:hypothetical protein
MATFNYTVDTTPMATEIKSVSRHVEATTVAVVAMQTAVILAEEKAADHVCNNVNKGFYSLIRSQISQKMAKLQSEVDSHIMQLVQQKNALLSIKNRMQKDYNMISGRYMKLFNGLNANLKLRVFELDKPTIDFAIKEIDKLSNRTKYLTAIIPITQLESLSVSQKIIASNTKNRGLNVIKSMGSFLFEMINQKKLTDQILINDDRFTETATVYIPIAICNCNRNKADNGYEIIVPEDGLNSISKSAIRNYTFDFLQKIEWKEKSVPDQEVISEFSKLVSSSSKPPRVKNLTTQLFQSASYLTL